MSTIASTFAPRSAWRSLLQRALAMFKRDAMLDLSYDINFWLRFVQIAISVFTFYFISKLIHPSPIYGYGGKVATYFEFTIVSTAFLRFQATAIQCFQNAIRTDQMAGTLESLIVTPTSLPTIILSTGLWAFALTIVQVVVTLLIALPFGLQLNNVNFPSVVVFTLLTIACMSPIGVMAAASIMTFKQVGPAGFVMNGVASLLAGVLFPISVLPVYLQYVSWIIPITHSLIGIRGALHGATLTQLAPDALWLLVASVILLPTSLWAFSRAVQRAKIDGTLGQY